MPLHAAVVSIDEIAKMIRTASNLNLDTFEQLLIAKNSETVLPYLGTPRSDNTIDPFTGLPINEHPAEHTADQLTNDVTDGVEGESRSPLLYVTCSSSVGHWLRDPTVVGLMDRLTFFVSCSTSVSLGQYVKSSLKVATVDEANREHLTWDQTELPCSFTRTGRSSGTAYKVIHLSNLDVLQPENRSMAIIVKHTGPVTIPHPGNKCEKVQLTGHELVGEVVRFLKKEKKNRKDPDSPDVACIKLTRDIMGLPDGTNARVPIECVCKVY